MARADHTFVIFERNYFDSFFGLQTNLLLMQNLHMDLERLILFYMSEIGGNHQLADHSLVLEYLGEDLLFLIFGVRIFGFELE